MNDRHIPFIRDYGDWVILDAGRRTAGSWRQHLYQDGSKKVPENRRYLAANSTKRNPNAPRGARFPVRPSKKNQTPTPGSNNGQDDERIPVLPPGPEWNPTPSFGYPARPTPGPSQPPLDGLTCFPQVQTPQVPSFISWVPGNQSSFPSSGAPNNAQYWGNPAPGAYTNFIPIH